MVDSASSETDGHCKDVGHVRVRVADATVFGDVGYLGATFLATTSCVNLPGYDGWVVQLVLAANTAHPNPSLRLLPPLAEVFPTWLRRARRTASELGAQVIIDHTFGGEWRELCALSPDGAKSGARAITRALAQAPAGLYG